MVTFLLEERNKAGVKPRRGEWLRALLERGVSTPCPPRPERLIFRFHVKHYRKSTYTG
jgi:hypothetical protein